MKFFSHSGRVVVFFVVVAARCYMAWAMCKLCCALAIDTMMMKINVPHLFRTIIKKDIAQQFVRDECVEGLKASATNE